MISPSFPLNLRLLRPLIALLFPVYTVSTSTLAQCFFFRWKVVALSFCLLAPCVSANSSLDSILDEARGIYKRSIPEALQYLESQKSVTSEFSVPDLLRFNLELADYYFYLLRSDEGIRILEENLTIDLDGVGEEEFERAKALKEFSAGKIAYFNEEWRECLTYFEKVRLYFDTTEDLEIRAYAYSWLGEVQYSLGLYQEGSRSFQLAAQLYDLIGNRSKKAEMLLYLGTSGVAQELGEAMENTLKILKVFEEEQDIVGMAAVYQNMGYDYNSDVNRSIGFFEKSIELSKLAGDIDMQLAAIAGLAETLAFAEQNERAKTILNEGLRLLEPLKNPQVEAHLMRVAGVVYTALGTEDSFAEAERCFRRSLNSYQVRGDEELVQAVKEGMSELELARGNYEAALPLAIQVTEWYRQNQEELYPSGLKLQKSIYHQMKDYESELRVTESYWAAVEEDWKSGLAEKLEILERDYEAAQKKNEIELLEKENLIQNQQIVNLKSQQRLALQIRVFGGLLIAAMVTIIVVLYLLLLSHRKNMRESQRASRRLESQNRELQEANERLKDLSEQRKQMLRMASHDLKNPLGSLSTSLELMEADLEPLKKSDQFSEVLEVLDLSIQSADYMRSLVEKMLDSQLQEANSYTVHFEEVDPSDCVEQMILLNTASANRKRISIATSLDKRLRIKADFQMLKEVIDNLLSNAVKYTPLGGQIELAVQRAPSDPDAVLIIVSDNGPGVPETEQSKLFDEFTKLSPQPTGGEISNGLGLSITKTLVKAMQGEIGYQNRPNGGAKFYVSFPSA